MPREVDPASNGDLRRRRYQGGRRGRPVDPAERGSWVVTVFVVSAANGASLLVGGTLAGLFKRMAGAPYEVLFVLVLLAAVAGVWLGAWLSGRLTGGDRRGFVAAGVGGMVGLVAAVGVGYASTRVLPIVLVPLAILSPGIGAALGAHAAEREAGAGGGP